jgi:Carboxypeptidase regulatory-like domain
MRMAIGTLAAIVSITACARSGLTALAEPTDYYAVSGFVVGHTDDGDAPLCAADVVATSGQYRRAVHTDGRGHFVLDRLTAGDWTVSVAKRGYLADAKLVSLSDADASISFDLPADQEPIVMER